ncbi:hypothetical protein AAMO2058_001392500 [Amorphochlora amoebiformis]
MPGVQPNSTLMNPNEAIESIVKQYMKKSSDPNSFTEAVEAFIAAVDWNERWLHILFSCQLVVAIIAVLTRKSFTVQSVLLMTCLGAILIATYINDWAMDNWRLFAGQAYFDQNGFFISAVHSGPLLAIALCILINMLCLMASLVIAVKRLEFKRAKAKKNKKQKSDDNKSSKKANSKRKLKKRD